MRYSAEEVRDFVNHLFVAEGLPPDRAQPVARVFVEADLLGFVTHGLHRVPANLDWLRGGDTQGKAEPTVLVDRGAIVNWDANQLPGPYVVTRAVEVACERAREYGQCTLVMRRAQHIACLAAYLGEALERNLVIQMICSTPGDRCVSAFGGIEPILSPNPFAFAAPTAGSPILIDMSLSIVAEGYLDKARREDRRMNSPCLKTNRGDASDDPAAYFDDPKGSIMPVGGLDHGYKGYGLCLWSELMTMALSNYGRADTPPDSEENSVIIQVFDPEAFGSLALFEREAGHLASLCRNSLVRDGDPPVRVPGDRALARKQAQLQDGLELEDRIIDALRPYADAQGIAVPLPLE